MDALDILMCVVGLLVCLLVVVFYGNRWLTKRFIKTCRGIRDPKGSNFYLSAVERTKGGWRVDAFLAKGLDDGGPSLRFIIPSRLVLSDNLHIVGDVDGYALIDVAKGARYKSQYI